MDANVIQAIRRLLTESRVLSLAVVVDGDPEAALMPYAIREDFGALLIQASGLARHAGGLRTGTRVGVLVHANDTPELDPLQIPRLTVHATVRLLDRRSEGFAAASARFIERFAAAEMTLSLGDFNIYELALGRGRYVEGFARAFNVGPETFQEIGAMRPIQ
jgi:putative heme iron utilization protein